MDTICSPHVNQVYVTKLYNLRMTVLLVEIKVWNCQIMRGSTKKKAMMDIKRISYNYLTSVYIFS